MKNAVEFLTLEEVTSCLRIKHVRLHPSINHSIIERTN
jgi:hypothetical protein